MGEIMLVRDAHFSSKLNFSPQIQRVGIRIYDQMLSFLKNEGLLGSASVYIPMGFDFFPALHTKVFGFSNRQMLDLGVFVKDIRELGVATKGWKETLGSNLEYINVMSGVDVKSVENELSKRGFSDIRGPKSLILKGTMIDMFEKEFDPDIERYVPQENFIPRGRAWLTSILELFHSGDHVLAFDEDERFFPNPRCHKVLTYSPGAGVARNSEILITSPTNATTRLYLPGMAWVYKVD